MSWWFRLFHPEVFQGGNKSRDYFEGWYFKQVDRTGDLVFALIPGISMDEEGNKEAFIQVIDGKTAVTHYIPFPGESFVAEKRRLEVRIGPNLFSKDRIKLELAPHLDLEGEILMSGHHELSPTLLRPGIMGWYSYIPFMECYHGLVSMRHNLDGWIRWNGKSHSLSGGSGYTEKDWGRSFPRSWVWMQSQNFSREDVSIMFSLADIPWIGYHFPGFLCSFLYEGKIYVFATYSGATLNEIDWDGSSLAITVSDKNFRLRLSTQRALSGILKAPTHGKMIREIAEGIDSELTVEFSDRKGTIHYTDTGRKAGVEMVGDVENLLAGKV